MLFAQVRVRVWPDWFDISVIAVFVMLVFVLPLMGYICLVVDVRAYYRRLKGALIVVVARFPTLPTWAQYQRPYSFKVLGLHYPCTAHDVKQAYRCLAEQCHPDRGGDPRKFHELHRHFENAMDFVRRCEELHPDAS
ncbi:MAG: DnaJ domain-containing protein [Planctomycetales bacterium]|nr:DnaJ domain-containing protein [Planctomycetales bacterium]